MINNNRLLLSDGIVIHETQGNVQVSIPSMFWRKGQIEWSYFLKTNYLHWRRRKKTFVSRSLLEKNLLQKFPDDWPFVRCLIDSEDDELVDEKDDWIREKKKDEHASHWLDEWIVCHENVNPDWFRMTRRSTGGKDVKMSTWKEKKRWSIQFNEEVWSYCFSDRDDTEERWVLDFVLNDKN